MTGFNTTQGYPYRGSSSSLQFSASQRARVINGELIQKGFELLDKTPKHPVWGPSLGTGYAISPSTKITWGKDGQQAFLQVPSKYSFGKTIVAVMDKKGNLKGRFASINHQTQTLEITRGPVPHFGELLNAVSLALENIDPSATYPPAFAAGQTIEPLVRQLNGTPA